MCVWMVFVSVHEWVSLINYRYFFSFNVQSPFYGEDEEELFQSICNEEVIYPRWFPADALNFVDKVNASY